MKKIILYILLFVLLIPNNCLSAFNQYEIYKLENIPVKYKNFVENQYESYKNQFDVYNEKLKVMKIDDDITIKMIHSNTKRSEFSGEYIVDKLIIEIDGKEILLEENCTSIIEITVNKKSKQFFYQRAKGEFADIYIGNVYLVSIDKESRKVKKELIIKNIACTNFAWNIDKNVAAFSDFEAIYILDLSNKKLNMIRGKWIKDESEYHKGWGYPKWCWNLKWIKNNLYFTYSPNLNGLNDLYYKIKFK